MNVLFITILFLVIIICIFTVFFILIYNNFQDSIIRINEVEGKIDECLRKKYDLLNRSVTIIKGRECVERGWITAFIDAGAVVSTPTCGPCLGGYMGILAAGERCIATTNRNFVGRMEIGRAHV